MSLTEITDKIHKEERRVGREVGSTHLIAVSKVQPNERVEAVLNEGHRLLIPVADYWMYLSASVP